MEKSTENKKVRPVAVYRIYTEGGGSKVLGNFGLKTPTALGIEETPLQSADGIHRAKFLPTANIHQKDTLIRITHGPHRGVQGNLDQTAKLISENPKSSGWTFWKSVSPPAWYVEKLAKLSAKVEAEMELNSELDEDGGKAAHLRSKVQGTAAASMGGLEE